ncbi:nucleosome assembly protein 19075338, putative [Eimeria tenella]|uniref:Nucleosome assembly protein 19075338, putative n=1 Tax=Eimeria tenella TaxID=5802 RepID=C8TDY6_EIMTE|nr:nucleosome assembly protein 19075338, putative [Eimeria tenella]
MGVGPGGRGAELLRSSSSKIEWAPERNVTKKVIIRKQRNKKTKETRTVTETVETNSFFNLFVDHEIPPDHKLELMDEKEGLALGFGVSAQVEELQLVVEADYDIGIRIRDKIIPRAVDWFLGQVDDDSDFEDYDTNEEEFDTEDSDEEDDSSDEDLPRSHKGRYRR